MQRRWAMVAMGAGALGLSACDGEFEAGVGPPGEAEVVESRAQALVIRNFPQHFLHEHHNWHRGGRQPGAGMPGSGFDFLNFHRGYMERARSWYLENGGRWEDVAPWPAIPDGLKRAEFGWNNRWAADEQRLITNDPPFNSADELGRFIENGIHNQFLHGAAAAFFREPVLNTFDSPSSTHFYGLHGLVDNWWIIWNVKQAERFPGALPD